MHVDLVCLLFLHASAENGCSLASCLNADMVSHILHAGKKVLPLDLCTDQPQRTAAELIMLCC